MVFPRESPLRMAECTSVEKRNIGAHACLMCCSYAQGQCLRLHYKSHSYKLEIFVCFLYRCNISPLLTFHKCILFFSLRASYSFATGDLSAFALERKTHSTSPFSGGSGTPGRRHVSITVIQRDAKVLHLPCVTALLLGITAVCV